MHSLPSKMTPESRLRQISTIKCKLNSHRIYETIRLHTIFKYCPGTDVLKQQSEANDNCLTDGPTPSPQYFNQINSHLRWKLGKL